MSTLILGCYYRVYVPTSLLRPEDGCSKSQASACLAVQNQLDSITRVNGGVTLLPGTGAWYNSEGTEVLEPVTVATWWFNDSDEPGAPNVGAMIDGLVDLMFAAGEACIAVEYQAQYTAAQMEMRTP